MSSDPGREAILFAGPTLAGVPTLDRLVRGIRILPPVKRRDVAGLVEAHRGRPGVLIIADGGFHQCLAVGHAEIRCALERGWEVWGVASMGAIRACEMRSLGMRGFGCVYDRFVREFDFQDDEVALLHEPEAPYRSFSEPLVHIRTAVEWWTASGRLSPSKGRCIIDQMKELWYGDRTLAMTAQLALQAAPASEQVAIRADVSSFERFRVKSQDLALLLNQRPWEGG